MPPDRLETRHYRKLPGVRTGDGHAAASRPFMRSALSRWRSTISGTGFSSVAYLRRFAFDKVKIDRSVVIDVIRDPASQSPRAGGGSAGRNAGCRGDGRRHRDGGGGRSAEAGRLPTSCKATILALQRFAPKSCAASSANSRRPGSCGHSHHASRIEFDIPIEKVQPAFMKVVGRKQPAVVVKVVHGRSKGLAGEASFPLPTPSCRPS